MFATSTLTSSHTFSKGYRPTIVILLDRSGEHVVSASVKSERIDAGQTRDFAPKVVVRRIDEGKKPEVNRPVVLKEGKVEEPVEEKTMLQK